jgi:D-amino peptidase
LISGDSRPLSMVHGIDDSFAAAFFVGFHTMCGVPDGILAHAYISKALQNVYLNGKPAGEIAIFAAVAGQFGVPVALVSGDQALAAEARELLGEGIETVVVKHAVGRFAAKSIAPVEACRRIKAGAIAALGRRHEPFRPASPVRLEVEFALAHMADMAELVPGSVRSDGRTLAYADDDFREVFRAWRAMYNLASVQ